MLTPKQARFVAEYIKDSNGTQAAIRAGYSPHTANEQAARLLAKVEVRAGVEAKVAKVVAKCELTLEKHIRDLRKLRDGAREAGQWSAAVTAETARGKASGLYVERVDHSGTVNVPIHIILSAGED